MVDNAKSLRPIVSILLQESQLAGQNKYGFLTKKIKVTRKKKTTITVQLYESFGSCQDSGYCYAT